MKPILDWLAEIKDEGIRAEAVCNYFGVRRASFYNANSLLEALMKAFCWGFSPQGDDFWCEIYNDLREGKRV